MSEKNTDYYMQKAYESIFNHEYHTEANNELFSQLIHDDSKVSIFKLDALKKIKEIFHIEANIILDPIENLIKSH